MSAMNETGRSADIQSLRDRAAKLGGTIRETEDFDANGGLYVLTDGNDVVQVPIDGIAAELDRWEAVDAG